MKAPLALGVLVAALLVGCGGGGGGSSTPSPFAGSYTGTWTAPSISDDGTANATIATNGHVTGTLHDNGANADGSMSGNITAAGNFSGTVIYPSQANSTITGTLTLNQSNHLVGNLQQTQSGTTVGVTFDLAKN